MRTKRGADALFPKIRKQILAALLMRPARSWFLSDLARHMRAPKTSLQRELRNLVGAGIILRRVEGRHVYVQANAASPLMPELQGLMAKTAGLVDVIRDALRPVEPRIAAAFVYGSVGRGSERPESDVDLMVVGEAGLADLALPLRTASRRLGREINPTIMKPSEFSSRARTGSGFTASVLNSPRLFVVGSEHDLEIPPRPRARGAPAGHPPGNRRPKSARSSRAR